MSFKLFWMCVGCSVLVLGCSSVVAKQAANEASSERPIDGSLGVLKESNDSERLVELWQRRKQESSTSDYPIGPGDVLEISVPGMEEIKDLFVRVSGEGTISLPFAGLINVTGMTDKLLKEEIRKRLQENYMQNPQVSLFVKEFRSRQVAVIGAVQKPGLYDLASSRDTIFSMISQAGGMRNEAAQRILFIPAESADPEKAKNVISSLPAQVLRQDPSPLVLKNVDPLVIAIDSANKSGNEMYLNIPARPGDVIMVPGAGEVLVQGWVEKPGSYKITPGLTMLGAVAAAGGPMYPADLGAVEIVRTNKDGRKASLAANLEAIKNGQQPDIPVMEGDVIDVSSSSPKLVAYGIYRFFTTIMHVGASVPVR